MSQEETQARALADWLSGPPGTPPPEGLDPDVVESIYAMRPDLAPPPSVRADDILALIEAGPLAAPKGRGSPSVVPFPAAPEPANDPAGVARHGRPWWALTGGMATLVAAAATLLLIAQPIMDGELGAPEALDDAISSSPASYDKRAASVEEAKQEKGAAETVDETVAQAPRADAPPPVARPRPRSSGRSSSGLSKDSTGGATSGLMARRSTNSNREVIPEVQAAEQWAIGDTTNTAAPIGGEAEGEAVAMLEEDEDSERSGEIAADAEAEPMAEPMADADDHMDFATESRGRQPKRKRDRAAGKKTAAAEQSYAPATSGWSDLSGLRAQAMPADLNRSAWRNTVDGVTLDGFDNARQQADDLSRQGRYNDAGDTLYRQVQAPPPAGQEFAIQAAERYLAAGNPSAALQAAQRGLSLSTTNTAARSYLLVLFGDAHQALGNSEDARAAYEQAAQQNRVR